MWLRAFCPQACYAGGPGRFRYLLYKDVNRHPKLEPAMKPLRIEPLTKEAFAAFGDVVEMEGAKSFGINQGFAERFNDLAHVDVAMEGGATNVSVVIAQRARGLSRSS